MIAFCGMQVRRYLFIRIKVLKVISTSLEMSRNVAVMLMSQ